MFCRCEVLERVSQAAEDSHLFTRWRVLRFAQVNVHAVEADQVSSLREIGRGLRHGRGQRRHHPVQVLKIFRDAAQPVPVRLVYPGQLLGADNLEASLQPVAARAQQLVRRDGLHVRLRTNHDVLRPHGANYVPDLRSGSLPSVHCRHRREVLAIFGIPSLLWCWDWESDSLKPELSTPV